MKHSFQFQDLIIIELSFQLIKNEAKTGQQIILWVSIRHKLWQNNSDLNFNCIDKISPDLEERLHKI